MFFTYEEVPQLKLWTDLVPALCVGLACDFEYDTPDALITAYTISGTELTITGQFLPSDITMIEMAYIGCTVTSSSDSLIVCELDYEIPAGKWLPEVTSETGIVGMDESVLPTEKDLSLTYCPI